MSKVVPLNAVIQADIKVMCDQIIAAAQSGIPVAFAGTLCMADGNVYFFNAAENQPIMAIGALESLKFEILADMNTV
jgi:hypothetical protein